MNLFTPILALAALVSLPALAASVQTIQTPLADYSREDLGGCAEALYSKQLQRTELYCPGAAGFEVTMTTSKFSEKIFLKKGAQKLELATGLAPVSPANKSPISSNLGRSGDHGIQNLTLRWKLSIQDDGMQVTSATFLGLVLPISYTYEKAPGEFTLANFLAVVRVDEAAGRACVVEYFRDSGQASELAQADQRAETASTLACLN